jgi:CBS domain-containing protein
MRNTTDALCGGRDHHPNIDATRIKEKTMMDVAQLLSRDAVTVRESDEVAAAARVMRERHVGYLVVVEPDFAGSTVRPIGVLTDRDIVVGVVAQDVNPRSMLVRDVMTRNPVVLNAADQISTALQEMRRIGVRRMPVVGKVGELLGVLSIDNVLDALSAELGNLAGAIRNELLVEKALRT